MFDMQCIEIPLGDGSIERCREESPPRVCGGRVCECDSPHWLVGVCGGGSPEGVLLSFPQLQCVVGAEHG